MKLVDITPVEFACGNCGCGCPAVLETESDTYIIIGKKLSPAAMAAVQGRVADDEYVIEVKKGMIDGLK